MWRPRRDRLQFDATCDSILVHGDLFSVVNHRSVWDGGRAFNFACEHGEMVSASVSPATS